MSVKVYYDGDCYFCSNYAEKIALEKECGAVILKSLRSDYESRSKIESLGYNVNNGFLVEHESVFYYGSDAFEFIRLKTKGRDGTPSSFSRARKLVSTAEYRLLVVLRYVFLAVQGLGAIDLRSQEKGKDFFSRVIRGSLLILLLVFSSFFVVSNQADYVCLLTSVTLCFFYLKVFFSQKYLALVKQHFDSQSRAFWGLYIIYLLAVTNVVDVVSIRRIVFFVALAPLQAWVMSSYISTKSVSTLVLAVCLVFVSFPGIYLAPFYGGIAGWYVDVDKGKQIIATAYELVRSDGEIVNLNHALLEPSTQMGRFHRAWKKSKYTESEYLKFQFRNYVRLYPTIKRGLLPHQRLLGGAAYPTHNLSDSDASVYFEFPPSSIVSVEKVIYRLDWSGEVTSRRVKLSVDVAER